MSDSASDPAREGGERRPGRVGRHAGGVAAQVVAGVLTAGVLAGAGLVGAWAKRDEPPAPATAPPATAAGPATTTPPRPTTATTAPAPAPTRAAPTPRLSPGLSPGAPATLVVDPGSGPAGTAVLVEGEGFVPGESVTVSFLAGPVGTARADQDGRLRHRLEAPSVPSYVPSTPVVVLADGNRGSHAGTTFTVTR